MGIVFGIRDDLSEDFEQAIIETGVVHVVAASGMNVTIVAGFLSFIFSLFLRRQIAIVLSILGIIIYAFMAGLEPSILRASVMGGIAFTAQILGRQNLATLSLFLTGFILLFLFPGLLFDIGFQLSFVSTLGLIHFQPVFLTFFKLSKLARKSIFMESFATTFSAQLATLPILLSNFGTYSLWSIIVNVLVLWTIPILMLLGGIAGIICLFFAPLASFFLYLSLPFLLFFEAVVNFFSSRPLQINLETFPWQFSIGYYFILLSIFMFLLKRARVT